MIEAANGASYLSLIRGTQGRGDIYLLGTCLETGNLVRHGLFVPTLLRMAESSRLVEARQLFLGRDQAMTLTLSPEDMLSVDSESSWSIEGVDNARQRSIEHCARSAKNVGWPASGMGRWLERTWNV